MGRVNFEIYGLSVDPLVISCDARSLVLDFTLHVGKVEEAATGDVVELCPFFLASNACRSMWNMDLIVLRSIGALAWDVDELQDEGSSCDDAASSGQEVAPYDVFEYGRFA